MRQAFFAAGGLAALALAAGTAQAQTTPNWTGGYVGAHLGYGFQSNDDDESVKFDKDLNGSYGDTINTAAGANAFSPGFCGGRANGNAPAAGCDKDDDGLDMGLRAGYDWQMGNWVFGGLAEVSTVNINDGVSAFSTTPASYTFRREVDWLAAARLRAGYAMGDYLGYVTGGVARANVDRTFSTTNGVNTFVPRDDNKVWGYQLGAGVERRVNAKLTIGLEYLYTSLKDDDYTVRSQGPAPATNPFILTNAQGSDLRRSDDKFDNHAVRITAAYRF